MEQYFTIKHVASQLNVNPMTVRRWIQNGALPAMRLDGGYRIAEKDIEVFVSSRRTDK